MTSWVGLPTIIEATPEQGFAPLFLALILAWAVIAINPRSLQRANRFHEVDEE